MSRYDNVECPVCDKKFTEGDDVVVCPVCGAPHHRVCYQSEGRCHFEEEHASGKMWEDRQKKWEEEEHCNDPKKCPKCSAANPTDGIFCQVCGYPLRNPAPENEQRAYNPYGAPPINPAVFTTPYGGVDPEEDIDGVTAKELALFVGENSFYYVPRIKNIKKNKTNVSWNWSACIFNFMYYFNRKMYLLGALMLALYILSMVPMFVFTYHFLLRNPDALSPNVIDLDYSGLQALAMISNVARYVYMVLTILSGMFANKMYTSFVYRRIRELRKELGDIDRNSVEYTSSLSAAGRTNHAVAIGSFGAVTALSFIISMVIVYLTNPTLF